MLKLRQPFINKMINVIMNLSFFIIIITLILFTPIHAAYAKTNVNSIKSNSLQGNIARKADDDKLTIRLNYNSVKIGVGESSVNLDALVSDVYSMNLQYISSNPDVASVNYQGIITGHKKGSATIVCTTASGVSAKCDVTVKNAPESITITDSNNIIQKNSSNHKIEYKLPSGSYSHKIKYSVDNKEIATVNSKGYITGKKKGTTTVTAETYNGVKVTQKIIVTDDSFSLNVNSTQIALDRDNVEKVQYGKSLKGRKLEAFIISNEKNLNRVNQKCKINSEEVLEVKAGPGFYYDTNFTLNDGDVVTRIETNISSSDGFIWDKITTKDNKTGYIEANHVKLICDNTPKQKVLLIDFAMHGFEDAYYRDGQVLVKEANALIEYFATHSEDLKNYKLVIIPCVNPDGTVAGKNNFRACSSAFGRCTANHVDLNRDFGKFKAVESRCLKKFMNQIKPNIYLNMHGWLNQTFGDKRLNYIIDKKLDLGNSENYYPSGGYAISWVHKKFDSPAALVEYKSPKSVSTKKDIKLIKTIIKNKIG